MMKSFRSIPGPKSWPIIGNLKDYVTKKYDPERLQSSGLKKYIEFGPGKRSNDFPLEKFYDVRCFGGILDLPSTLFYLAPKSTYLPKNNYVICECSLL